MQSREGLKFTSTVESDQVQMYSRLWLWGHELFLLVDQLSGDLHTRYL